MQSKILSGIGIDPAYILLVIMILIIVLFVMLVSVNMKYNRLKRSYMLFMRGKDGKSLEDSIAKHLDEMENIEKLSEENQSELKNIKEKLSGSFQKAALVRYDAFNEMGGKLSFAFTVLDGKDNGWILNAMHSREGCYIYVKEVVHGESYMELAEEEAESLERAMYQETYDLEKTN